MAGCGRFAVHTPKLAKIQNISSSPHHEDAPVRLVEDGALPDDLVVLVHPRELRRRLRPRLARQVAHPRDEPVELALILGRPLRLV